MKNNFEIELEFLGLDLIVKGTYYPAIPDKNMFGAMEDAEEGCASELYIEHVYLQGSDVDMERFMYETMKDNEWEQFYDRVEQKILYDTNYDG